MNSFEKAQQVEQESRAIIEPILERASDGRFVYTEKGRLAKEFQRQYGDVLLNMASNGEMLSVELKAERKSSQNLFLEFWSNRKWFTFGWMAYSKADLLFYHFLESDELYITRMQMLRRWFWHGTSARDEQENPPYRKYEIKPQNKYEQKNDTWGVCVPVKHIQKKVGLKKVNPLGLFGLGETHD